MEKKKRIIIECHPDLIKILDDLRKPLSDFTYGTFDKNITYKELTEILAKKIMNKML